MRFLCLGCEVLARALYLSAAQSPHVVDVELLPRGLHENSADLRSRLQDRIDSIDSMPATYDAILLAYGLCGGAAAGLRAKSVPLVVPRAHDCITLFLGSRSRYLREFSDHPGTYWYTQDYMERSGGSGSALALGTTSDEEDEAVFLANVEKYGRDNAEYLRETMGAWQHHYQRAAFIEIDVGDEVAVEARALSDAAQRGWTFDRLEGDLTLIRRLLFGEWDDDVLQVPPGEYVTATYDDRIVGCRRD
jgi:hypothetical protein